MFKLIYKIFILTNIFTMKILIEYNKKLIIINQIYKHKI